MSNHTNAQWNVVVVVGDEGGHDSRGGGHDASTSDGALRNFFESSGLLKPETLGVEEDVTSSNDDKPDEALSRVHKRRQLRNSTSHQNLVMGSRRRRNSLSQESLSFMKRSESVGDYRRLQSDHSLVVRGLLPLVVQQQQQQQQQQHRMSRSISRNRLQKKEDVVDLRRANHNQEGRLSRSNSQNILRNGEGTMGGCQPVPPHNGGSRRDPPYFLQRSSNPSSLPRSSSRNSLQDEDVLDLRRSRCNSSRRAPVPRCSSQEGRRPSSRGGSSSNRTTLDHSRGERRYRRNGSRRDLLYGQGSMHNSINSTNSTNSINTNNTNNSSHNDMNKPRRSDREQYDLHDSCSSISSFGEDLLTDESGIEMDHRRSSSTDRRRPRGSNDPRRSRSSDRRTPRSRSGTRVRRAGYRRNAVDLNDSIGRLDLEIEADSKDGVQVAVGDQKQLDHLQFSLSSMASYDRSEAERIENNGVNTATKATAIAIAIARDEGTSESNNASISVSEGGTPTATVKRITGQTINTKKAVKKFKRVALGIMKATNLRKMISAHNTSCTSLNLSQLDSDESEVSLTIDDIAN